MGNLPSFLKIVKILYKQKIPPEAVKPENLDNTSQIKPQIPGYLLPIQRNYFQNLIERIAKND